LKKTISNITKTNIETLISGWIIIKRPPSFNAKRYIKNDTTARNVPNNHLDDKNDFLIPHFCKNKDIPIKNAAINANNISNI